MCCKSSSHIGRCFTPPSYRVSRLQGRQLGSQVARLIKIIGRVDTFSRSILEIVLIWISGPCRFKSCLGSVDGQVLATVKQGLRLGQFVLGCVKILVWSKTFLISISNPCNAIVTPPCDLLMFAGHPLY
jgi:hypothetical protein